MEVAKALVGSFKLVTLAPKTVREMTQLPRKHKRVGIQTNQKGEINTQSTNLVIGRSLLNNYTAWNIMLAMMLQDYCVAVASDNCFD